MRIPSLMIVVLLAIGSLLCNTAWALPDGALTQVHATPPHSHTTPTHAHGAGETAADPCELTSTLSAPSFSGTAPQPGVPVVLRAAFAAVALGIAQSPRHRSVPPFVPTTPVQRHVVLVI